MNIFYGTLSPVYRRIIHHFCSIHLVFDTVSERPFEMHEDRPLASLSHPLSLYPVTCILFACAQRRGDDKL